MRSFNELYRRGISAEKLAQLVLFEYYDGKEPSFPIDPFKMIRDFGIVYQFMEFKDLEGIYILPDAETDIPVIGINFEGLLLVKDILLHMSCVIISKIVIAAFVPSTGRKLI